MHLFHCYGNGAGTGIPAEVVAEVPRRQKTHLKDAAIADPPEQHHRQQHQTELTTSRHILQSAKCRAKFQRCEQPGTVPCQTLSDQVLLLRRLLSCQQMFFSASSGLFSVPLSLPLDSFHSFFFHSLQSLSTGARITSFGLILCRSSQHWPPSRRNRYLNAALR